MAEADKVLQHPATWSPRAHHFERTIRAAGNRAAATSTTRLVAVMVGIGCAGGIGSGSGVLGE